MFSGVDHLSTIISNSAMPIQGSIEYVLTYENPRLNTSKQDLGPVTKHDNFAPLTSDDITPWNDFTYDNIVAAYSHVLNSEDVVADVWEDREGSPFTIEETTVDNPTLLWNSRVCRQPLKKAAAKIQQNLGLPEMKITMKVHVKEVTVGGQQVTPDWSIYIHDANEGTQLVWGVNKLSSRWNSDILKLERLSRENWIWPFRQVLTYCIASDTRYGCPQTPDELVVLRAHKTNNEGWGIEYKSIPWENSGPKTLTVNLGI